MIANLRRRPLLILGLLLGLVAVVLGIIAALTSHSGSPVPSGYATTAAGLGLLVVLIDAARREDRPRKSEPE